MASASPRGLVLVLTGADETLTGGYDTEAVRGVDVSVEAIRAALTRDGQDVAVARVGDLHALIDAVRAHRPSMVVNLIESLGGRDDLEPAAASVLELLRVPYTGSAPLALGLCQRKPLTKTALLGLGVPTARWQVLRPEDVLAEGGGGAICAALAERLTFPVIVKQNRHSLCLVIKRQSLCFDFKHNHDFFFVFRHSNNSKIDSSKGSVKKNLWKPWVFDTSFPSDKIVRSALVVTDMPLKIEVFERATANIRGSQTPNGPRPLGCFSSAPS